MKNYYKNQILSRLKTEKRRQTVSVKLDISDLPLELTQNAVDRITAKFAEYGKSGACGGICGRFLSFPLPKAHAVDFFDFLVLVLSDPSNFQNRQVTKA